MVLRFISGGWGGSEEGVLWADLRDDYNDSDDPYSQIVLAGRGTDQWHHLAVVNDGYYLKTYLDYQQVSSFTIGSGGDNTYTFNEDSLLCLGCFTSDSVNGGWIKPSLRVDEFRLTSKALVSSSFLKTIVPRMGGVELHSRTPLQMDLQCHGMPGRRYNLQYSSNLTDWTSYLVWQSVRLQTNVVVDLMPDPGQALFWRLQDPDPVSY
jgi:hypothetical protein